MINVNVAARRRIKEQYDCVYFTHFCEGIAAVQTQRTLEDKQFFFINENGQQLFDRTFYHHDNFGNNLPVFKEGVAVVAINKKNEWVCIDREGKVLTKPFRRKEDAEDAKDSTRVKLIELVKEKYPAWRVIGDSSEGITAIKVRPEGRYIDREEYNYFFFMDENAKKLFNKYFYHRYDMNDLPMFSGGLALVNMQTHYLNSKPTWVYINNEGKILTNPVPVKADAKNELKKFIQNSYNVSWVGEIFENNSYVPVAIGSREFFVRIDGKPSPIHISEIQSNEYHDVKRKEFDFLSPFYGGIAIARKGDYNFFVNEYLCNIFPKEYFKEIYNFSAENDIKMKAIAIGNNDQKVLFNNRLISLQTVAEHAGGDGASFDDEGNININSKARFVSTGYDDRSHFPSYGYYSKGYTLVINIFEMPKLPIAKRSPSIEELEHLIGI